jgi:hypothetical protein
MYGLKPVLFKMRVLGEGLAGLGIDPVWARLRRVDWFLRMMGGFMCLG